jgi:trimeric autotransporter adhesin
MATTKISTGVLKDGSVTSAKLDTNISIVGDLTVDTNTLFVDSASNNVGIGTSSPSNTTHIYKNASLGSPTSPILAGAGLRIQDTNNSMYFDGNAIVSVGAGNFEIGAATTSMKLITNGAERMNITSTGNVGIGTDSPTDKLSVYTSTDYGNNSEYANATIGLGNTAYPVSIRSYRYGGSYLNGLDLYYNNGTPQLGMRIDSSGNVGIGTSSPQLQTTGRTVLDVNGTSQSLIALSRAGSWSGYLASSDVVTELASRTLPLAFTVNNAERMRIDSSGNVGIGTGGAIDAKFHITGSDIKLQAQGQGGATFLFNGGNNTSINSDINYGNIKSVVTSGVTSAESGALTFETRNSGTTAERMRIGSSGNVTIGDVSASAKLNIIPSSDGSVSPFLQFIRTGTASQYASQFVTSGTEVGSIKTTNTTTSYNTSSTSGLIGVDSNTLGFKTNSAERMRLEADGDLHVDGDVIAYSTTISDQRLKDDVQTIDNALDKVCNLRGVSYTWNNGSRKGQKDLGLIAQEVEQVLPELVREKEMPMIDGGTYKTVDYEKIVGVLIEAVKELKAEIESLKSK